MKVVKVTIEIVKTSQDKPEAPDLKILRYEDKKWDNDEKLVPVDLRIMLAVHDLIGKYNGDTKGAIE